MWMTIAGADAWEGEPCQQDFFCLEYPVWIFQDSTFQSIFSVCFPPSFCTFSGQIVSITKSSQQRRWIAYNRPHAAGPDTGKSCTVGGIWFPEHLSVLCSGRCPRTAHLGLHLPRRAQGPDSFVSLRETRRCDPRQPKCHCTPLFTQLSTAHSEPLHSVQKLRENFLRRFVFGQKIGVLFIPLCDTCLSCRRNS